ncbi:MAG TPA: tRNA adenosine deaminase-associated protein [Actinomycetes bacterium]|nr:tRNA adenosine deaminase-associated protein [Actinomycetes bacterium]
MDASALDDAAIDFAIAAVREDGIWQVSPLPPRTGAELEAFLHALRQQPGEVGTLGFVSVAEDFFVAARVRGEEVRLLLSDVTCVPDWPLAAEVLVRLGLSAPEGPELEESTPAGDLEIFADLGLPAMELAMLCEDLDLYPDEQIGSIATRLGFGEQYETIVDAALG